MIGFYNQKYMILKNYIKINLYNNKEVILKINRD